MGDRSRTPGKPHPGRLPVEAFLRRKRWSVWAKLLAAFAVVLLLVILDHLGPGLYATDDARRYHGKSFEVVRVIDGDTIVIRAPDGQHATTTVRVWGVDTPELARRDGSKPDQPLAVEATAFVRSLVEGGSVTLHLEESRLRGHYGRLLAHVELADGSQLGARLIAAGFSEADDRWSHHLLPAYALLELQARADGVGLWASRDWEADEPITRPGMAVGGGGAYTVAGGVGSGAYVATWGGDGAVGGRSILKLGDSEGTCNGIWPIKRVRQAA